MAFKTPYEANIGGEIKLFNTFPKYMSVIGGNGHEATVDIAYNFLGADFGEKMDFLYNESKGARYHDYQVSKVDAAKSFLYLKDYRNKATIKA